MLRTAIACLASGLLLLCALWATGAAAGSPDEEIRLLDKWRKPLLQVDFPDPDADAKPEAFAGADSCTECHEERRASLLTSFHASLLTSAAKSTRGCEECHGPAREHVASEGDEPVRHPWDAPERETIGMCITCHEDVLSKPIAAHRAWTRPGDDDAELRACTHCHEIHVDRSAPAYARGSRPFPTAAALAEVAEHIPSKRCIACHPTFHPEMSRSGHAHLMTEGDACGTCHGPGSLHEESGGRAQLIIDPRVQRPADVDAACLTCHSGDDAQVRWMCSEHGKEGVSCIACHDANARRGRTLRDSEFELCGSCHADVKASFRLPNGHRVERGDVACSDCHDPHANHDRVRDRDVRVRSCEKCHAEKSGPFLHDHGVKRTDGCTACHAPHGSPHRRLLNQASMRGLCLECHPDTFHDLSSRKYQNCIACHVEIHGSDVDRFFLR